MYAEKKRKNLIVDEVWKSYKNKGNIQHELQKNSAAVAQRKPVFSPG